MGPARLAVRVGGGMVAVSVGLGGVVAVAPEALRLVAGSDLIFRGLAIDPAEDAAQRSEDEGGAPHDPASDPPVEA